MASLSDADVMHMSVQLAAAQVARSKRVSDKQIKDWITKYAAMVKSIADDQAASAETKPSKRRKNRKKTKLSEK